LREKTASASESLANNLAANAADDEEAVHGSTMEPSAYRVKALFAAVLPVKSLIGDGARRPWLIIIKLLRVIGTHGFPCPTRCAMRPFSASLASLFLFAPSAALADSRVFIIANQADGYGVDQCLARGDKCGAHAARSYCQSRDFSQGALSRPFCHIRAPETT
jgi:hypothetical protein